MSSSNQLRQEAAQLRGRINCRACLIRQRIDSLMHRVRTLARSPYALPVAFVCGILAERLRVPGFKCAYGLLVGLGGQLKAMKIASSLIDSPVR